MSWGDNGVTIARQLLDQQVSAPGWGNGQLLVPFRALRTAGYLRKFRVFSPRTTYAITHGTGTNAIQGNGQMTAARAFRRCQLILQGIAPLYDVEGMDVPYLRAMCSGDYGRDNYSWLYDMRNGSANPNANAMGSTADVGMYNGSFVANTSIDFGYMGEFPVSEKIIFRDSVVAQKSGSVVIADKPLELGILTLQNTQSNVLPSFNLNPMYTQTATNPDAQLQTTGNDTITGSPLWNLSGDLFDVPDVATDRPLPFQQAFVITRQSFDTVMTGGNAIVNYSPAGFLVRMHARFLDANNNIVDINKVPTATIDTKWGATVDKFNETVQENITRQNDRAIGVALPGAIYQDFMAYDGTVTDYINTAILPNVRTELKNFTTGTAIATVRTCVTRMIPVKVS